jgi:hypothetical protein
MAVEPDTAADGGTGWGKSTEVVEQREAFRKFFITAFQLRHYACRLIGLLGMPEQWMGNSQAITTALSRFKECLEEMKRLPNLNSTGCDPRLKSFILHLGSIDPSCTSTPMPEVVTLISTAETVIRHLCKVDGNGDSPHNGNVVDSSALPDGEIPCQLEWCARRLESIALCLTGIEFLEPLVKKIHRPDEEAKVLESIRTLCKMAHGSLASAKGHLVQLQGRVSENGPRQYHPIFEKVLPLFPTAYPPRYKPCPFSPKLTNSSSRCTPLCGSPTRSLWRKCSRRWRGRTYGTGSSS